MKGGLRNFWKRFLWETKKDTLELWNSIAGPFRFLMRFFRVVKAHPVLCAVLAVITLPFVGICVAVMSLVLSDPETSAEREWRLADYERKLEIKQERREMRDREKSEQATLASSETPRNTLGLLPQEAGMRGGVSVPPPGTHISVVESTERVAAGEGSMLDHMRAYRHPGQVQVQPGYGQMQDAFENASPEEKGVAVLGAMLMQGFADGQQRPDLQNPTLSSQNTGTSSLDAQMQNAANAFGGGRPTGQNPPPNYQPPPPPSSPLTQPPSSLTRKFRNANTGEIRIYSGVGPAGTEWFPVP